MKYLGTYSLEEHNLFFPGEHYPFFPRENCSLGQLSPLLPQEEGNLVPFSSRENISVGQISIFLVSNFFNPLNEDITFFILKKI